MLPENFRELNPVKSTSFADETEHCFEQQYSFKFQDFLVNLSLLSTYVLYCLFHIPELSDHALR